MVRKLPNAATADKFHHERLLLQSGWTRIAGVDEAGRGPLAGPVVAAAVVFPAEWITDGLPRPLERVNDSKQLSEDEREALFAELTARTEIQFAIEQVEAAVIDQINILQATHRAMNLALARLDPPPQHVLVDGLRVKTMTLPQTPMVSGDALSYSIGAASILAKVSRDRFMLEMEQRHPGYGFAAHKGYGTPAHLAALQKLGPCPIHRRSFAPIRERARQIELRIGTGN